MRTMAERTEILRCLIGSSTHGLHLEGTDDRDEMGVCVEDMEHVGGFQPFEQFIYRTAAERESKHDAPSKAGDLDLTIYSLRKFLRLAMQGNPNMLTPLFIPQGQWIKGDARGRQLQELAPFIINKGAGGRYLGYLQAQRQRLLGERGGMDVSRLELAKKYGYDTKFAMHMIRLGHQGVELLKTGVITFPMPEAVRLHVKGIRTGKSTMNEVLQEAGDLEQEIKDLLDTSPLPSAPDIKRIEAWMLQTYWEAWKCRRIDEQLKFTSQMRGE